MEATQDVTNVLDEMVKAVTDSGYDVPEGLEAPEFLEQVAEIVETDKELSENAREFLMRGLELALAEAEKDEEECEEGDEECAARKAADAEEDEEEDEQDESIDDDDEGFALDESSQEVVATEAMSALLDSMVAVLESCGYDVPEGMSADDFLEEFGGIVGEDQELDEAKKRWGKRAHAYAIGKLGKMHSHGGGKTSIRAFSKPRAHAKK